jgi:hypothetical protein
MRIRIMDIESTFSREALTDHRVPRSDLTIFLATRSVVAVAS